MKRSSRLRPSPAMVVALIALIAALSTVAYAASKIDTNDLKNGAVTAKKLHRGSVTTKKIKRSAQGVAIAGLNVNKDGSIASWFNRVGGQPKVTHLSGDFNYDIVIPGASVSNDNSVLSATPETGSVAHTLINAGYFTTGSGVGAIVVQTKTPTGFEEQGFHLLVFRARG